MEERRRKLCSECLSKRRLRIPRGSGAGGQKFHLWVLPLGEEKSGWYKFDPRPQGKIITGLWLSEVDEKEGGT